MANYKDLFEAKASGEHEDFVTKVIQQAEGATKARRYINPMYALSAAVVGLAILAGGWGLWLTDNAGGGTDENGQYIIDAGGSALSSNTGDGVENAVTAAKTDKAADDNLAIVTPCEQDFTSEENSENSEKPTEKINKPAKPAEKVNKSEKPTEKVSKSIEKDNNSANSANSAKNEKSKSKIKEFVKPDDNPFVLGKLDEGQVVAAAIPFEKSGFQRVQIVDDEIRIYFDEYKGMSTHPVKYNYDDGTVEIHFKFHEIDCPSQVGAKYVSYPLVYDGFNVTGVYYCTDLCMDHDYFPGINFEKHILWAR